MSRFLKRFAKGTLVVVAEIWDLGADLLCFWQKCCVYPSALPPGSRTEVPVPTDFEMDYEDLTLRTSDKVQIRAYLIMQRKEIPGSETDHIQPDDNQTDDEYASTRPTVIILHGNVGNHGHRLPVAQVFFFEDRCNIFMLSYRGYGLSKGSPSEKGLRIDSQTALDYVTSHPHLSKTPIILYGQSLGGAVAVDLASRNPTKITALILENTFLSIPNLLSKLSPILRPLALICHQKWDSASKMALIPRSTPILMLSGVMDEVIPHQQMLQLWEISSKQQGSKFAEQTQSGLEGEAGGGKSRFLEFPWGRHNNTCMQRGYWPAVREFIMRLESEPGSAAAHPLDSVLE